jgi:hypothetical protein
MTEERSSIPLTALQWTLGVVILIEAVLFVMPVLLLIPRTVSRGGWVLLAIFVLAIAIHLIHGMYNVGDLAIYTTAAWAIANGKSASRIDG